MPVKRRIVSFLFCVMLIISPVHVLAQAVEAPVLVGVGVVTNGTVEHVLKLDGVVHPAMRAVISSEVKGSIARFNVDEGTFVEDGEAICQLDKTLRLIQLEAARAELKRAQAAFTKVSTGYRQEEIRQRRASLEAEKAGLEKLRLRKQRAEELFNKKMAFLEEKEKAHWEYEESLARLSELQAELDLAKAGNRAEDIIAAKAVVAKRKAELEEIEYELGKTTVIVPFSGVIVSKTAEKGEWVKEGDSLAEIISIKKVLINTAVSEEDIAEVKLGRSVKIFVSGYPNNVFSGHVKHIIPQAGLNDHKFPVKIEVDNPRHLLLVGMRVTVNIPIKKDEDAILVPRAAVRQDAGGAYLFVVAGDVVNKIMVELGTQKEDLVSVTGNIIVGSQVVVSNTDSLKDHSKVRIKQ